MLLTPTDQQGPHVLRSSPMQPVFPDLKYEIWAKELANDLDRDFILNGEREDLT